MEVGLALDRSNSAVWEGREWRGAAADSHIKKIFQKARTRGSKKQTILAVYFLEGIDTDRVIILFERPKKTPNWYFSGLGTVHGGKKYRGTPEQSTVAGKHFSSAQSAQACEFGRMPEGGKNPQKRAYHRIARANQHS